MTSLSEEKMKRVTFEISDELHKKLKLLCYTESVSIGHILRQCVSDFCDKHDAHLIELIDNRSQK
ncbi:plasmid partition protein ParG [Synechococcus sp. AH-551-C10]|nr:plasmid partition protein ParG [Synechococcus sp. AH-551-C10]MDB4659686.1 plasmid partition protein ParG [Synechococcus sp. AH-551-C10]